MAAGAIRFIVKKNEFSSIARQLPQIAQAEEAAAADEIVEIARLLCPVSDDNSDGHVHLRDTIKAEDDGEHMTVSADTPYAGFVHDGTVFMEARPFLAQAAASVFPTYRTSLTQELKAKMR